MKVHLIRSEGFKMEDYNHVFNILNQYSGGITFVPSEPIVLPDTDLEITFEDETDYGKQNFYSVKESFFEDRSFPVTEEAYTWEELFEICNRHREVYNIPQDEQVFLLTDKKNEENWFGAADERTLNNFFVDCSDWHYYFKDFDVRFPITYCIAGWLMRKVIFASADEMRNALHIESIGCLMDFCEEKKQIALKMRTADICDQCLSYSEKNDSNRVYMNQLMQIMDGVRSNLMFRDRSKYLRTNSRLEFRGMMHKMYLTDLGDLQVNLNPKERALYLVYMNHPTGIKRSDLIDLHSELKQYYAFFSNKWDNNQIDEAVDLLTDALDQNFMQVLSRIRRKFKDAVGEEQYKSYSIESHKGTYRIVLERELVSYDEHAKLPAH
ncbi:hypothetical protein N9E11_01615 [Crocinitomicaceae bacterium]|nr:hypothetical protein [Crocinitomicaceae bacterium]